MRKTYLSLSLLTLSIGFTNCSFAQGFEGKIIYLTSIENANPPKTSNEQFNQMFSDDIDTIAILYLSQNRYKLVTLDAKTNSPKTVTQYDPDLRKNYSYIAGDNSMCMVSDVNFNSMPSPKISKDINDTLTILGKKCSSLVIDYGIISKTKIYYSIDYKVDIQSIENDAFGFLQYIYESKSLPLKIIVSGNGAIQNQIFTVKEVREEKLDKDTFKIPKFKKIIKSPL